MGFEIALPLGEREIVNVAFNQSVPFALGLTDRAVYVPVIQRWSLKEPWSVRRVPIEQVRKVAIRRTRRASIIALSTLMVVAGLAVSVLMLLPLMQGGSGKISILPFVAVIAGIVLLFTTRGRRTLPHHLCRG